MKKNKPFKKFCFTINSFIIICINENVLIIVNDKNLNCPARNGKLCIGVFYCEHAADSPVAVSDIKEWLAPKVVI